MAIPDEDVARVREATDMVALVSEHSALKRQGTRWVGLCPFHQEKTPSFSVNAEVGVFYCFGCQRSGDAITFVRDIEHVEFVEAVRRLAERAGVAITEDATASADRRRRAPLYEAMAKAVDFYHERLLSAPDGGRARDYLRSRGYDGDTVRQFRLGWAPDDWDGLARHLSVSAPVLSDAGLGFVNRRGRQQDAFRSRVIFPIFDPSGRPIALGGRILPPPTGGHIRPANEPKYKNSADGPIYSKRRTLYGLNWAKKDVIDSGEVIVCEGYTDVIGFFQAGLPRAVATCGTALGEEHFRLLRNFAKRVVLAYDADAAGQSGAGRVYEWERLHEVELAVAVLPPGADPADLARSDPGALRAAVAAAQPFLRFRVERVLASADLGGAEGRARAAEEALAAVVEHPNELVRDQYLMLVADRCRLDPAMLRPVADRLLRNPRHVHDRRQAGAERAAKPEQRTDASNAARRAPTSSAEAQRPGLEALRLAVHRPESVVDRLEPFVFLDPLQRHAFETLAEAESLPEALELAEDRDPNLPGLLRRLMVEEPTADADDVVVQLVRIASRRALADVEAEARLSPDAIERLAPIIARVRGDLDDLDEASGGIIAADRLLAWLSERHEESG
ncbi:MAG TPA: DNA primase [Acidimicrobiales bacterium]|nr:DNA primase [Acidimicrobiales bacterium]